jgi:hypothetical protein
LNEIFLWKTIFGAKKQLFFASITFVVISYRNFSFFWG